MANKGALEFQGVDVPNLNGLVHAPTHYCAPVSREVEGKDGCGVPLDDFSFYVGPWVPQANGAVMGGTGQNILVGGKYHIITLFIVAMQV